MAHQDRNWESVVHQDNEVHLNGIGIESIGNPRRRSITATSGIFAAPPYQHAYQPVAARRGVGGNA